MRNVIKYTTLSLLVLIMLSMFGLLPKDAQQALDRYVFQTLESTTKAKGI